MDNNNIPQKSIIFLNELSVIQNWRREQTLGSGAFAIITLWVNTQTSDRIALKQFRNNHVGTVNEQMAYYNEQWKQEIQMMKSLQCENVVKALDLPEAFLSLKVDTPILGMEFCSGGDLRKVLNKPYNCCGLEEKEVRQILKQISCAIEYLHGKKIIHRDLKPENIVLQPLTRGKVLYKLTDLGYAKQLSDSTLANSFVGTLEYLAPELFLRVKYSSAVDNWSFGLLAYEVITGRRPFLPNHSMGEILEVLKKKKSSQHICTEVDDQGNFYFSSEISRFNNICSALKADLEVWLRIVLEYDPNKRGGRQAFKLISESMRKCVVQVFSIDTYDSFSYEITERTTLKELRAKLTANTNIAPDHHYLVLPNGETAREAIGAQIIESWYRPDSWFEHYNPIVINVFDYSKNLDYYEFYKSLTLPQMVEKMLLDPSRTMEYDEIKLTWRHSVWVARQSVKKYQLLHSALKSTLLNCINAFNQLQDKHHQLATSLAALFASAQVLRNFIGFSANQSREMIFLSSNDKPVIEKSNDVAIRQNVDLCLKIATILKSIYKFRRDKVRPLFAKTQVIVPKFSKDNFMFENTLKSSDVDAQLMRKYNDILAAYDSLRKKKKEERSKQTPNSHMVNLLCDCFQQVESLMKEMFAILKTFVKFIKEVDQINGENKEFQNLIENWQQTTTELHTESWAHLTKCFVPTSRVSQPSTAIHSKLMAMSLANHANSAVTSQLSDLRKKLDQVDSLLLELDQSQTLWNSEKIEFAHLELYNLLF